MYTTIFFITTILFGLLAGVAFYLLYVTYNKYNRCLTWIETLADLVNDVLVDLDKIDSSGAFRADDEVGHMFEAIKNVVLKLKTYGFIEIDEK